MTRPVQVAVVLLWVASCTSAPPVVVAPPVEVVDATPLPPPPPPPPDTMISWRVPEPRPEPLVEWGPAPAGEVREGRVRTFDLQHQVVRVRFDWDRGAVIGSTTLRVAPLADTLPVAALALDAVAMAIARVRSSSGAVLRHDYDGRTLTVHLPSPIRGRSTATFTIDYESVRPARGVHFVPRRRTVWTQGQAEDTRHWVPTFDHPSDRTTWEIFVRTQQRDLALANGRLIASRRVGAETEWHWRLDASSPTYLMSIVAGDYTVLQDRWRSIPVGYWTYPDSVAAAWRGFGKTPRMMEWLTVRTGVAYPWNKYDQAVVPEFIYGGMENVTASTLADDAVLHPAWAEPHAHAAAEGLVMHELAHQWFGNLVSVRDWPHAWLNEGFARMLEAAWREEDHGRDEAEYVRATVRDAAIAADLRARRPLVWSRWADDPIEMFLTGHVYARGAAVLEMLRAELGDPVFWAGIRRYLGEHRMASVETDDLRAALEAESGRNLEPFFAAWVHGAGFPVFRVQYAYDSLQRGVVLEARQVQPRDSLTGWFDVEVEVEVLTDSGAVRAEMGFHDGEGRLVLPLRAPPLAVLWDRGARLLHVTDFPRPTVMLAHQLRHARDVPARLEAVGLLGDRVEEPKALMALARALRTDSFWALRMRAARVLAASPALDSISTDTVLVALLSASGDGDPRVREAAASSLGPVAAREPGSGPPVVPAMGIVIPGVPVSGALRRQVVERLDSLSTGDASGIVRAAALRSLALVDYERASATARDMLSREGWLHVERLGAIRTLATAGVERRAETTALLVPLLDDRAAVVRATAASALGMLADPAALTPLESRVPRESDASARRAMEAAIERIRGGGAR